jgi:hypothetical protein
MHESAAHHDELKSEHSHRTRALQALVCGALTGFSVGILLAPSRGADTRHRFTSAARAGYERTRRFFQWKRPSRRPNTATVASISDRTREAETRNQEAR